MLNQDHILDLIFDEPENKICYPCGNDFANKEMDTWKSCVELDKKGVKAAEENQHAEAIALFDKAIGLCGDYASAYNNQAQVYRITGENDKALQLLNESIIIAERIQDRKTLSNAYMQRATLYRQTNTEQFRSDIQTASSYGNKLAKQLLNDENPYAKMCNQIVSQLFHKE